MTILQSLAALYDRLDRRDDAPQPGYSVVGVAFAIPIRRDGSVEPAIDLRTGDGTKRLPVDRTLPKLRDHNNSGKDPFLFWDNTGYALGLVKKEMKRGSPEGLFESFKAANLLATEGATTPELLCFRAFLTSWSPSYAPAIGLDESTLDLNVVFRCVETGFLIHECSEAKEIWRNRCHAKDGKQQICLVSGCLGIAARLHPKFPSLEAGGSKGPIVSFDKPAFQSYGKEQGDNAPVSEDAAFKYGAALNWLLDRSNGRSFRLGETTVVFWADDRPQATDIEQCFFSQMSDRAPAFDDEEELDEEDESPPADIDKQQAGVMREQASDARFHRRAPDAASLDPAAVLHVLGLSPNAGRIAVRFWLVDTWGAIQRNIERFKADIQIEPPPRVPDKKAYALLFEIAVQGKAENIPPRLGGELARSVLSGAPYPQTLLSGVIARVRADKTINAERASLCKAVINRNNGKEVIPVALDQMNPNPAYRLGRLFALIEGAQKAARPGIKATVKDRYFGAACATPARVFPLLHKNAMNHLASVRKERGQGLAHWMEQEIGAVWAGLSDNLPRALRLEDQGRFIAGYYHQRFSKAEDTPAEAQKILAEDSEGTEE